VQEALSGAAHIQEPRGMYRLPANKNDALIEIQGDESKYNKSEQQ